MFMAHLPNLNLNTSCNSCQEDYLLNSRNRVNKALALGIQSRCRWKRYGLQSLPNFCYSSLDGANHFCWLHTVRFLYVQTIASPFGVLSLSRSGCFRLPPVGISASKSIREGFLSLYYYKVRAMNLPCGAKNEALIFVAINYFSLDHSNKFGNISFKIVLNSISVKLNFIKFML